VFFLQRSSAQKCHNSLCWHGKSKMRGNGEADENDTEKSAKLVIDHVANKSVHMLA
jgi:hypothetical protein